METLNSLYVGFQVALIPVNLLFCFTGVVIGTLVGVLPGIGPVGAMALLLPATFGLSLAPSLIMLAGIYYGAMYGGSTTSILVNIPGEAASVVTCVDGYQMARKGRAGAALGISAIGSFVGRHPVHHRTHARRQTPGQCGLEVRPSRVLRPHVRRLDRPHLSDAGSHREVPHDGPCRSHLGKRRVSTWSRVHPASPSASTSLPTG